MVILPLFMKIVPRLRYVHAPHEIAETTVAMALSSSCKH